MLGLLLGQFAVRGWRWAALCGLANALAVAYLLPRLNPLLLSPATHLALVGAGALALWGISRLPHLPARVGAAIGVMPLVLWTLLRAGMVAFWFLAKSS